MDKDIYEILGIEKTASDLEIKKAYALLVRKYPPEKEKEKFSEISRAYDILSNKEKRKEYDETHKYNPQSQSLLNQAFGCMEEDNYDEAIRFFKKFIMLEPESVEGKNFLGVCEYRKDNYEAAYNISKEILDKGVDLEEVYFSNLYTYSKEVKKYKEAENYLKKGIVMLNSDKLRILLSSLYVYSPDHEYTMAKNVVREINLYSGFDEYSIDDYLDLALSAGLVDEFNITEKTLTQLLEITTEDSSRYVTSALEYYLDWMVIWRRFDAALIYIDKIIQVVNIFGDSISMNTAFKWKEYRGVFEELGQLLTKEEISGEVERFLINQIRINICVPKNEKDELIETQNKAIDEIVDLISEYSEILKTNFDNIMKYKNVYSTIYIEMNPLKKKIDEELNRSSNHNYSSTVSSTSSQSSNRNNSSNVNNSSSDSNKAGCFIVVICTVLGASFFGVIGAIIGFYIGCKIAG